MGLYDQRLNIIIIIIIIMIIIIIIIIIRVYINSQPRVLTM